MSRTAYKKISTNEDKEIVSFVSLLFFQWMNSIFKIGSERPLDENDFIPPRYYSHFILARKKASLPCSYLMNPFNTATPLIGPDFFGPLVLTGFHCTLICLKTNAHQ